MKNFVILLFILTLSACGSERASESFTTSADFDQATYKEQAEQSMAAQPTNTQAPDDMQVDDRKSSKQQN